jgi:hypothetical protein
MANQDDSIMRDLRAALAAATEDRDAAQRQLRECLAKDNGRELAEAAQGAASAIAEREALSAKLEVALDELDQARDLAIEVHDRFIRALAIKELALDRLDRDSPDTYDALRLLKSMDSERDLFPLRGKFPPGSV